MENLNKKVNNFFSNIDALASLILRFGIGIAFIIHGANKFPLPPQGLIEYFGLSPALASTVALSELLSGLILIISGFIKNPFGNMLTRLSGLNIAILMITILIFAHKDWFFTTKLFTSEQIFLLIGGVYFLIKGNEK
ncbi:DoxX family protein [Candidatus Pelagibacter sp.]|nr:DoxX family protein [Candidatus Pelagibacter sp.]